MHVCVFPLSAYKYSCFLVGDSSLHLIMSRWGCLSVWSWAGPATCLVWMLPLAGGWLGSVPAHFFGPKQGKKQAQKMNHSIWGLIISRGCFCLVNFRPSLFWLFYPLLLFCFVKKTLTSWSDITSWSSHHVTHAKKCSRTEMGFTI